MNQKLILFIIVLLPMCFTGKAQSIELRVCKKDGSIRVFNIEEIRKLTFAGVSGINEHQFSTVMKKFYLLKSYPNPFNTASTISYELPSGGNVEIVILDLNGRTIKTLPGGNQTPGVYTLTWDGTTDTGNRALTGIYICRVKYNNQIQTNKMVLIK